MSDTSGRGAPLALILCLCSCLTAQGASAREHGAAARFGNDVFMAGSDVVTDGSRGDAILAGAWVSTSGAVQGDEVATGGQVRLDADVDGALYAAGGHVQLDGKVARNARIAGDTSRSVPRRMLRAPSRSAVAKLRSMAASESVCRSARAVRASTDTLAATSMWPAVS